MPEALSNVTAMELFSVSMLLTGVLIFAARVADVSVGTIRTIATVQGRSTLAFFLGIIEVLLWLVVIAVVIQKVTEQPLLAAFYALGFSTGNVVGIWVEKRLALGHIIFRVITPTQGRTMADRLREMGYRVTIFQGEGARGIVSELYVVCERKDSKRILKAVQEIEPDVFYITEQVGETRRMRGQLPIEPTGWRSIRKRK